MNSSSIVRAKRFLTHYGKSAFSLCRWFCHGPNVGHTTNDLFVVCRGGRLTANTQHTASFTVGCPDQPRQRANTWQRAVFAVCRVRQPTTKKEHTTKSRFCCMLTFRTHDKGATHAKGSGQVLDQEYRVEEG